MEPPSAFPSGAGGLVSTIDDYLAFGQMMLSQGKHASSRILSRLSVELMTTDQLTPEQKAVSGLVPGYFDSHGWGCGMSVVIRRDDVAAVPGRYGWHVDLGATSFRFRRGHIDAAVLLRLPPLLSKLGGSLCPARPFLNGGHK